MNQKIKANLYPIDEVQRFYFTVPTEASILDMPEKDHFSNNYKIQSENPIIRDIPMADGIMEKKLFIDGKTEGEAIPDVSLAGLPGVNSPLFKEKIMVITLALGLVGLMAFASEKAR